jgi:2-C-methyl-D-erythritol 4-phosphate cytidylyltransferase
MTRTTDIPAAPVAAPPTGRSRAPERLWALIPCAGAGSRAGTPVPKQYQVVAGRPLVLHTLAAFAQVRRLAGTLVLVSASDNFLSALPPSGHWRCVACGGATRAGTVGNGLAELHRAGAADHDWVLVHDAARCLITAAQIDQLIDACMADAVGGLLAHPVADTLKLAAGARVAETTDRTGRWLAQTPQMFRLGVLRDALLAAGERVTDESSAIEALGLAPLLVPGSAQNFKVTYPEDFLLAQAVLQGRGATLVEKPDYDYP